MDTLPEDVLSRILDLLNAKGLIGWSQTAKRNEVSETHWERCLRRRFEPGEGPYSLRPKSCGATTFARAYRELTRRISPPRTLLTPRHQKIAGKGRSGEIAGWITVAHRSDCRTVENVISLNIIIQNIGSAYCQVSPHKVLLFWLCRRPFAERDPTLNDLKPYCDTEDDEVFLESQLETRLASITDYSLLMRSKSTTTLLKKDEIIQPFHWLGFQIQVKCPSCTFEADFLERAVSCQIPFFEISGDHPGVQHKGLLNISFLSSDQFESWYMNLPGGCVTLNTERML